MESKFNNQSLWQVIYEESKKIMLKQSKPKTTQLIDIKDEKYEEVKDGK